MVITDSVQAEDRIKGKGNRYGFLRRTLHEIMADQARDDKNGQVNI